MQDNRLGEKNQSENMWKPSPSLQEEHFPPEKSLVQLYEKNW